MMVALPPPISSTLAKRAIQLASLLADRQEPPAELKGLLLPAIQGWSGPEIANMMEWSDDNVNLFQGKNLDFKEFSAENHYGEEPSPPTIVYKMVDRATFYALLVTQSDNAVVLMCEGTMRWQFIGYFGATTLHKAVDSFEFRKYSELANSSLQLKEDSNRDRFADDGGDDDDDLSDYWEKYDRPEANLEDYPRDHLLGEARNTEDLERFRHVEVHLRSHVINFVRDLWQLYDSQDILFRSYAVDILSIFLDGDSFHSRTLPQADGVKDFVHSYAVKALSSLDFLLAQLKVSKAQTLQDIELALVQICPTVFEQIY